MNTPPHASCVGAWDAGALGDLKHPTKAKLERAMEGHVLAEAELVGVYKKHR